MYFIYMYIINFMFMCVCHMYLTCMYMDAYICLLCSFSLFKRLTNAGRQKMRKNILFHTPENHYQYCIACLVVIFFANMFLYHEDFFSLTYKCLCIRFSLNSKSRYLMNERMKWDNTVEEEMRGMIVQSERKGWVLLQRQRPRRPRSPLGPEMGGVVSVSRCWVLSLSSFLRFWIFMIISWQPFLRI